VKNYSNKTVVIFSKAQRDIVKGEKLFSIKRNYLNPEQSKIITQAAIFDEENNKIITKATAPYQDGLSVSDANALRSGDEASIVIHAKNISGVESFQIDLYYPNALLAIDTSKGNNGVELLNTVSSNTLLSDPIDDGGVLKIIFTTQNGTELNLNDEDIVRVYVIAKDVDPKEEGVTSLEATLMNSNLNQISTNTFGGNVVVYDLILLGDFDDPGTAGDERDYQVGIDDFLVFLDHYGTVQGDTYYDKDFDIYPAEIAPIGNWLTDSIYSISVPDGKIDLYDFIIFARNYGKSLPMENSAPVFGAGTLAPADGDSGVSITTALDFPDATDAEGDTITYDVYLGTDQTLVNNLDASVRIASNLSNSQTSTLSLDRGTTYYWKVVAKDGKGGEAYLPGSSTTYSFSTETLDKIFVAGGEEGVFVMDVSTLSDPEVEQDGSGNDNIIDLEGYVYDVLKIDGANDKYIAVAEGDKGLTVLYYDNTAAGVWDLEEDTSLSPFYLGDKAKGLAYKTDGSNKYILVAAGAQGLYIVQFNSTAGDTADSDDNPTGTFTLTLKSHLTLSGDSKSVTVDGTAAYVATGSGGMVIVDITDVTNPQIISTLTDIVDVKDIKIDGEVAYVAGGESGVYKVDITDKTAPVVETNYDTAGYAEKIEVEGNYVYVADGSNGIVKLDKTTFGYVGKYNTDGYAKGIVVDGGTGFVGDSFKGLKTINVNNMSLLGEYNIGSIARNVFVAEDRYLIVADGDAGVKIYDAGVNLSNIANPTLIKTVDTPGYARSVYYVHHNDGGTPANEEFMIYVADGPKGLAVIDADAGDNDTPFEDENDIALLNTTNTETSGYAYDVYPYAVDGAFDLSGDEYLYVADGSGGLVVFDITTQARTADPQYVRTVIDDGNGTSNVGVMMAIGYD
ncbi:LVIVD repeat-containing protein, partial [Marinitoga sp. 1197]|uniref:LVIVD repeat-containing protein n=1 Tax=Marinitoga sp. 1197 TaxID=1428449 RepID=UPI00064147B9